MDISAHRIKTLIITLWRRPHSNGFFMRFPLLVKYIPLRFVISYHRVFKIWRIQSKFAAMSTTQSSTQNMTEIKLYDHNDLNNNHWSWSISIKLALISIHSNQLNVQWISNDIISIRVSYESLFHLCSVKPVLLPASTPSSIHRTPYNNSAKPTDWYLFRKSPINL